MSRKVAISLAGLVLALSVFFLIVPGVVETRMNTVRQSLPYQPSERGRRLHERIFIADLHADSLLWGRDLLARGRRGHVDVPRLIEGNVALQAFTIVTKSPRGLNIEKNDDRTDNITLLALAERWPPATWGSLRARAFFQAHRLHEMTARSRGRLTLIRTAADLTDYVARRQRSRTITAGFLGVEGAHPLEGRLENLDLLFEAGIRMMAPTHFFDNEIGGSAAGVNKIGLTPLGRDWVRRMEAKHMIVDLAHASPRTIEDVLALATRPVVVSHTGLKGTCDNQRNLSDEQARGVARTGGVIGLGYWPGATCSEDAGGIVRAVRYAVNLVGVDHVGLGSDFDGAIQAPFDTTGLVRITDTLLSEGLSEAEVEKIMGGNVLRMLLATLP